jgi:hypothetical protein
LIIEDIDTDFAALHNSKLFRRPIACSVLTAMPTERWKELQQGADDIEIDAAGHEEVQRPTGHDKIHQQ